MLSADRKKQWLNATWRLTLVWTVVLVVSYLLRYGWMKWPTWIVREHVLFIGNITLAWWLVFLLQAIYPAANSLVLLATKLFFDCYCDEVKNENVGMIVGGTVSGTVGGTVGLIVGLIVGGIVGGTVGGTVGLIVGAIVSRIVLPKLKFIKWFFGIGK